MWFGDVLDLLEGNDTSPYTNTSYRILIYLDICACMSVVVVSKPWLMGMVASSGGTTNTSRMPGAHRRALVCLSGREATGET